MLCCAILLARRIECPDPAASERHSNRTRRKPIATEFPLASKGFPSGYSRSVCVRLHSENSEPKMLISQTTPDEHPPTPPPCRWPALITSPTLAKFQLVWRRLCDVLFRSCLVEHTLTAVCALPEYQSRRKYNIYTIFL